VSGAVFLAGGGSPQQEELVWREAFSGARSVAYWPFALPEQQAAGAADWLRTALAELRIETEVEPWTTLDGHRAADLDHVDLLFVGGGSTSRLSQHIRDHGFTDVVREFVGSGGRYYGGSAGAVLACGSIAIAAFADGDEACQELSEGLGLVAGVSVLPHANTFSRQQWRAFAEMVDEPVLAVPEASGLRCTSGVCTVIGPEPVVLVDERGEVSYPRGEACVIDVT